LKDKKWNYNEKNLFLPVMKKKIYRVIGVMSGTSLDGVDLAYIEFEKSSVWEFDFLKTQTISYPEKWRVLLKEAFQYPQEKIDNLNREYTLLLAEIISNFISEHHISDIDAICSHGHTILHQPKKGITLQIGNLSLLAEKLGKTLVCDFRKQDVDFGGQGAPLVPIGDRLLFPEYDFCVNLGGFSNVSFTENNKTIAWDICPVNTVLNFYAQKLGKEFDENGKLAALGTIDYRLLEKLNQLEYYAQKPPKSLGIEWVNEKILPLIEAQNLLEIDVLATFVSHIAGQIAKSLKGDSSKKCLFTGGGVYNDFLIQKIREQSYTEIIIPNNQLVEYKEALIFGLMGVLKLRGEINVLGSVTGCGRDHSSGVIWEAKEIL